jgi:hypothetical protein
LEESTISPVGINPLLHHLTEIPESIAMNYDAPNIFVAAFATPSWDRGKWRDHECGSRGCGIKVRSHNRCAIARPVSR